MTSFNILFVAFHLNIWHNMDQHIIKTSTDQRHAQLK